MKICAALWLVVCLLYLPTRAVAQDLQEEKEKLQQIQTELEKSQKKLQVTRQKEKESLLLLYDLTRQLRQKESELGHAKKRIAVNEQKITHLATQVRAASGELASQKDLLKRRLIEMYKSRGLATLELILSSHSTADLIHRSYFFQKMVSQDLELVAEIERRYRQVKGAKIELQNATEEIRGLSHLIAKRRSEIKEKAQERQAITELLKEKRRQYEQRVAELEHSSRELEHYIQRIASARGSGSLAGSTGRFRMPSRGRFTSRFGYRRHPIWGGLRFHTGLDIASPYGTEVVASDGGEVILADWWDGYGKAVVIRHGRSFSSVYGHLSRIYVRSGDRVQQGQLIGLIGSTGFSTGPHLHFEIRVNGKPVNPMQFLR